MTDRIRIAFAAMLVLGFAAMGAEAHHGWRWAETENSTLEGTIVEVRLGNPHGMVTVETADGALWQVEVGQPWRNQNAGLTDELLRPGVAMQVEGHRSADPNQLLIKAERVRIGGTVYDLYPGRD